MATSATQRTIRALKQQGRVCAIVEKFNPHHGMRQDLFGIIDIIALDPQRGVVGVQSCTDTAGTHIKKLHEERRQQCVDWLSTPGTLLEIWAWGKRKRKLVVGGYGKSYVWTPRVIEMNLNDFMDNED